MAQSATPDYTAHLRHLMQQQGLTSFKRLSQRAGVSEEQILRLRRGQFQQMRLDILEKLGQALGVTIVDLLHTFSSPTVEPAASANSASETAITDLQQEYQRLQAKLLQQREELWQEFQQTSLQTLEPWLLQWSAAAYAAQQNPQVPAVRLLPLLRPVEQLLQQWGIEATAPVGTELPYDPQRHQLMDGVAAAGDLVRVRYAGYQQGDRLLYRAKVSPVN